MRTTTTLLASLALASSALANPLPEAKNDEVAHAPRSIPSLFKAGGFVPARRDNVVVYKRQEEEGGEEVPEEGEEEVPEEGEDDNDDQSDITTTSQDFTPTTTSSVNEETLISLPAVLTQVPTLVPRPNDEAFVACTNSISSFTNDAPGPAITVAAWEFEAASSFISSASITEFKQLTALCGFQTSIDSGAIVPPESIRSDVSAYHSSSKAWVASHSSEGMALASKCGGYLGAELALSFATDGGETCTRSAQAWIDAGLNQGASTTGPSPPPTTPPPASGSPGPQAPAPSQTKDGAASRMGASAAFVAVGLAAVVAIAAAL